MAESTFADTLQRAIDPAALNDDGNPGGTTDFTLMPLGEAFDMGHAEDGTPLIDPRLFYTAEFRRNPWPYYRLMRDHYPVYFNKLNNTYYVTRYHDMTECYYDDILAEDAPVPVTPATWGRVKALFQAP